MAGHIDKAKRQAVLSLREEGLTSKQIADRLGLTTNSWICKVLKEAGLGGTSSWKEKRYKAYRDYKAQGHTNKEVAEKFGISEGTAVAICKGIAPQKPKPEEKKNQYTNGEFDREANAIRWINERAPGFEYAGNFTGMDGFVDLRCKTCGTVCRKSFVSVRHGSAVCKECKKRKSDLAKAEKEAEKEAERQRSDEERERKRKVVEAEKAEKREARRHPCPICGAETYRAKYCSDECAKKANNRAHDLRKRRRIQDLVVDLDISLERLFQRDKGVCHICGGACDWDDSKMVDGFFVVGTTYPTVDHVWPISLGGKHSWDNVKLAHHACNTRKSNKVDLPLLQTKP